MLNCFFSKIRKVGLDLQYYYLNKNITCEDKNETLFVIRDKELLNNAMKHCFVLGDIMSSIME